MNVESYFERIGFKGRFHKADLETLRSVHMQHVLSIPFENLSIHCGEVITLDLESIYNKIVVGRRGGWCFENNLLFSWVLKEMGYSVTMLGSRVFNSSKGEFSQMESHLINKVVIDGTAYIADVSYGTFGQIWHPLELISGKDQPQLPGVFRLTEESGTWILVKTGREPLCHDESFAKKLQDKQSKQIYSFTLTPRSVDHFLETSQFLQTSPESLYTNKSICSLQTLTGFSALVGWTYIEVIYNYQDGVDLFELKNIPNDEIDNVLKEKFSLFLKNRHTPINIQAKHHTE
ncbi:hypothetical protein AGOR_G00055370 [Albula goreensis]|uniref:arylamine N-acetyltransferase n=1 Tax=Albula goreensis TaxID=1534307 RepID=A0A8T3E2Y3_9TELE|nr:hypothetical protein AGOR_G00055370 [Albula goreensis]